jgi:hypothetical protein
MIGLKTTFKKKATKSRRSLLLPEAELFVFLCPGQLRNPLLRKAARNNCGYLMVKRRREGGFFPFKMTKHGKTKRTECRVVT